MFHESVSNRRAFSYLRKKRETCVVIITFYINFRSLDLQTFHFQSRERDRHRNYHLRFYIPRAVSNSRTFFVFTRTRKERGTVFIINGYTANVKKKKKEKKTTRTSRKCFVSRRE